MLKLSKILDDEHFEFISGVIALFIIMVFLFLIRNSLEEFFAVKYLIPELLALIFLRDIISSHLDDYYNGRKK